MKPSLRIYYINLDHRTDRRDYMEAQFRTIGLSAERISASTPADIAAADLAPVTFEDARRGLAPTEIATSISHQRAWRRMLGDGETQALVLEDDCELSPLLPAFLAELDRQGAFPGVVRLETRLRYHTLERRVARTVLGIELHHPFTWEWGTAAYVISADEARRVLASEYRFGLPIDDTLLSPESPLRDRNRILQAVPALAFVPEDGRDEGNQPGSVRQSELQADRQSRFDAQKPKVKVRKLVREFRRVRRQIADIRQILRHRIFGRIMVVPFARNPVPTGRSSVVPPRA